ncbi:sugar transferase [Paracoccaceae bacterium GXU_MW_L88]
MSNADLYVARPMAGTGGPDDRDNHLGLEGGFYSIILKRLFDIVLVLISLPIVLPVVLLLAYLISRDGSGAFYSQSRVGRNGGSFRFWKLRSMIPDADEKLEELLASDPVARQEWEEKQKLNDDPRVTRLGRFIRKTSLDELPQLWNVLIGDMSLVGPRPMLPEQRALYPGRSYFYMRPGLTGYWQISDRSVGSFAGRAHHDARYLREMSLATDVSVMMRTALIVVRGTGC